MIIRSPTFIYLRTHQSGLSKDTSSSPVGFIGTTCRPRRGLASFGVAKLFIGINDISINVLELLGMLVRAWLFLYLSKEQVKMHGDNEGSLTWIQSYMERATLWCLHALVGRFRGVEWLEFPSPAYARYAEFDCRSYFSMKTRRCLLESCSCFPARPMAGC